MDKKLFVGNLAWETSGDDLKQYFSNFGTVESAEVMLDKFTGRARGFGFVVMSTAEEAQNAVEKAEGVEFMGRPLKVNIARPREERPPRSRGGFRDGGYGAPPRRFGGGYREGGYREGGYYNRGGYGGERRGGFRGPRDGGYYNRDRGGYGEDRRGGFRGPRNFDETSSGPES